MASDKFTKVDTTVMDKIGNDSDFKRQMEQATNIRIQEHFSELTKPLNLDNIQYRNPNEKIESLLKEQLKQYEAENCELRKQLTDAQLQLKQLNDKEAYQNLYIKELKADLKEESLKHGLTENKLSIKDWKTALVTGIIGLIVGIICALI